MNEKLIPYHEYLEELIKQFKAISFTYMKRTRNQFADALATLASMIEIPEGVDVRPIEVMQQDSPSYCNQIEEAATPGGLPWYHDIKAYLEERSS